MGVKKFGIWIVKNLVILLLVTLIFSTTAFDMPELVKGIFKDIFQYASPEMQKEVVSKLTLACSGLEGNGYGALQQAISKGAVPLDFKKIGALCKDYNGGKINDREFFFSVLGSSFPEKLELPKSNAIEKYNSIVDTLNKNKLIYFVALGILLALLYLLIMDIKLFIITLTGISLGMGIMILLPYASIIAYEKVVGIDTTPVLATIFSGNLQLDPKAIVSVILLMILRTYTSFIIILGAILFGIGIAGKIYSWKLKRQSKTAKTSIVRKTEKEETKKSKAAKEEKTKSKNKELDEDVDEAYKHRDRTAKETLDELEEMHKRKMKEKES